MPWDVILTIFCGAFALVTFAAAIQRRRRGADLLSVLFFLSMTALAVVVTVYRLQDYWGRPPAPIPAVTVEPIAAPPGPSSAGAAPVTVTPNEVQIGYGKTVAERYCASCHQIAVDQPVPGRVEDVRTGAFVAAPTFDAIARDPKTSGASLRALLLMPHHPMPDVLASVTSADLPYLIAYIMSLGPAKH